MDQGFAGVRVARPEDEDEIVSLILLLHSENGMFTAVEEYIRDEVRRLTHKDGGLIGVIDGESGKIEGTVGFDISSWWYTDDLCINEKWNFVHPDHRRTTHAKRLIEFGKWCSDQLKIPLFMGIITNDRTEAKERLYRRQLHRIGGYFTHGFDLEHISRLRDHGLQQG